MSSGVKILLLHHSFHIPFPVHFGVFYVTDYTQCLVCHVSLSLVFQPAFCTVEQKTIIQCRPHIFNLNQVFHQSVHLFQIFCLSLIFQGIQTGCQVHPAS